jgi:signal transduction histidine kinase
MLEEQQETATARIVEEMRKTADAVAGAVEVNEVLNRLAARAAELTGAHYVAISTFGEDGRVDRFVFTGMDERVARRLGEPPRGRGILGVLAHRDTPLRVDDVRTHPRFTGWPAGHPEMAGFLGVPIRALGSTIGSLYMTRRPDSPPFTADDELAAVMLSLQVAGSISTVLANERSSRIRILEERERIAHDLHDGTIQALYALGLRLDAAAQMAPRPEVREALREGVAEINQQIADMRQYIGALESRGPANAPDLARDLPFVARQLAPAGVDVVTNIAAAALQEVSSRAAEDLLFIAREAMSNAIRHGRATKLAIDLRQTRDEMSLTVQDNGTGFDQATARIGLGTVTMRTRAERLGGSLTVLGIPGMGTTVRVVIPRRPGQAPGRRAGS